MKMQKILRVSLILVVMALGVYALNSVVNGADEPTPAEMRDRLQKAFDEAYLKGNLDALDEIFTPDTVTHMPNRPDVTGIDAIKGQVKTYRLIFSECRIIHDELFVSGDRLVAPWTFQGTFAQDRKSKWIFQNKDTEDSETVDISISAGTKYIQKGCTISRLVDYKTAESWLYTDDLTPRLTAAGIGLEMKPIEE
jgi:hypothetical protein